MNGAMVLMRIAQLLQEYAKSKFDFSITINGKNGIAIETFPARKKLTRIGRRVPACWGKGRSHESDRSSTTAKARNKANVLRHPYFLEIVLQGKRLTQARYASSCL
jgi:hypothetical protein